MEQTCESRHTRTVHPAIRASYRTMIMKIERDQRRFRADRPRPDPRKSAQVRHARRDDRPQGSRSGQHSRAAARRAALPLRRQRRRAASARATAKKASRSPRAAIRKDGSGPAGSDPGGGHLLEVDISLEELAAILGEELELPRIEPQGQASIVQEKVEVQQHPPDGPRVAAALQAHVSQGAASGRFRTGVYEPDDPRVIPIKADKQYRSWNTVEHPQVNAAVIYMMDVSGSMTDEQKEIVRTEAFWIDTWLSSQYDGIETRYIIHDAVAKEVDEHTFYHTRESGGTRISSAYKACAELDRREVSRRRNGTCTASSSPTATTGARTTRKRSRFWANSCCRS